MMTTLKRAITSALALANYGVYGYDSAETKAKFVDENGLVYSLTSDGLRDQNLIINGGYDYAQRQAPATLTTYSQTASRQYAADRFGITNENTSVQYRRVDTTGTQQAGLQAQFYGEYSKITSAGKIVVSQVIEASTCQHLRGRKVRFQMKLKASVAKTMRLALLQLTNAGTVDTIPGYALGPSGTFVSAFGANSTDPTFGANLSKIAPDTADNATIAASGLNCAVTTVWQKFGGTFTLPTDFKNLVAVLFTDSQFSVADLFGTSEAGLYDGVEVRDWAAGMPVQRLLSVQRCFCKSFNIDVNPAVALGTSTGEAKTKKVVAGATAGRFEDIKFPVMMRSAPNIVLFNPGAAGAQARDETNSVDCTATASTGVTERQTAITFTGNAATVAEGLIGIHWTADADI